MGIAFDRYRCIMQPDKCQLTVKTSCLVSLAMGLLAMGMSIPLFKGTELKDFDLAFGGNDILLCNDVRSGDMRLVYDVCRCVVQFVMPLVVVLGVYISIGWRLKNRPVLNSRNSRRRRRTNIMIISVSTAFFLSWLPMNTLNFLLDLGSEHKHEQVCTWEDQLKLKLVFFWKVHQLLPHYLEKCYW